MSVEINGQIIKVRLNVGQQVIDVRIDNGYLQIKYNFTDWINFIPISSITGSDGREVELQKTATHIQWRYVGTSTWIDLVALSDLKGDAGVGIASITKTNTVGLVDTYTITYTDSTTSTFDVTNGQNGTDGENAYWNFKGTLDTYAELLLVTGSVQNDAWYVKETDINGVSYIYVFNGTAFPDEFDGIPNANANVNFDEFITPSKISFANEEMIIEGKPAGPLNYELLSNQDLMTWTTYTGATKSPTEIYIPYTTPNRSVVFKDGIFPVGAKVKIEVNVTELIGTAWIGVDDTILTAPWRQQNLVMGLNEFTFDHAGRTDTTVIIRQETTGNVRLDAITVYLGVQTPAVPDVHIPLNLPEPEKDNGNYINIDYQDSSQYTLTGVTATKEPGYVRFVPTYGTNGVVTNKAVLSENAVLTTVYRQAGSGSQKFGFKSINGANYFWHVACSYEFAVGTNRGKIRITTGPSNNTFYSTALNTNYVVGDVMKIEIERKGLVYNFTIVNLTKGWTIRHSITTTPTGAPFIAHNTAKPFIEFISGNIDVFYQRYRLLSKEIDTIVVGDSITFGQAATTQANRYGDKILIDDLLVSGGGADGIVELNQRVDEIIYQKPKRVMMMIGGNDIMFSRPSALWQGEYLSFRNKLVANGIEVIHLYPTPRTHAATLISYINSAPFLADMKIDTNTPLMNGNSETLAAAYNSGDGLHPNNAGFQLVADTINAALGLV